MAITVCDMHMAEARSGAAETALDRRLFDVHMEGVREDPQRWRGQPVDEIEHFIHGDEEVGLVPIHWLEHNRNLFPLGEGKDPAQGTAQPCLRRGAVSGDPPP